MRIIVVVFLKNRVSNYYQAKMFIIFLKGNSSSDSKLIKYFLYLIGLAPFIASIFFPVSFQSFVYFSNTFCSGL